MLMNLNPHALGSKRKVVRGLTGGLNQGRGDALRAIRRGANSGERHERTAIEA